MAIHFSFTIFTAVQPLVWLLDSQCKANRSAHGYTRRNRLADISSNVPDYSLRKHVKQLRNQEVWAAREASC